MQINRRFKIRMWRFIYLSDCFKWLLTGNVPRNIPLLVELPSNPKKYHRLMGRNGPKRLIKFLAKHFANRDIFINLIPEHDEDKYRYSARQHSNIVLMSIGARSKENMVRTMKCTEKRILDDETALDKLVRNSCRCNTSDDEVYPWQTEAMLSSFVAEISNKNISLENIWNDNVNG